MLILKWNKVSASIKNIWTFKSEQEPDEQIRLQYFFPVLPKALAPPGRLM
jgi:hypothetical protein